MSSVRDFVSHKDQQKAKAAERLVLLPDQRISAEAAAMEAAEYALLSDMLGDEHDTSNVLVLEPNQPADRAGLEATIAELEAAVTAQSDDWEADEGHAADPDRTRAELDELVANLEAVYKQAAVDAKVSPTSFWA